MEGVKIMAFKEAVTEISPQRNTVYREIRENVKTAVMFIFILVLMLDVGVTVWHISTLNNIKENASATDLRLSNKLDSIEERVKQKIDLNNVYINKLTSEINK